MIFHLIACLYGLYLQTLDNLILNFLGIGIIYNHSIDSTFDRSPAHKNFIRLGAFLGILIGWGENNILIYFTFLFSFLSKFPCYVTTLNEQLRTIAITLIFTMILYHQGKTNT